MGLNAVGFGMMGLVYGLSHWIFYTSGVRANPAWWEKKTKPGELVPEQGIGAMGALAAAISLLLMAVWHFATDPFNGPISTIFSIVPALYGFLFLGTFFCATQGWDWRPVGDAALWGATTQFILIPIAAWNGVSWDFNVGMWVYGFTASTWGLVIHGKCSARIHQFNLCCSMFITWWYMIFGGGILNWEDFKILGDIQNMLPREDWAILWIAIGIINMMMIVWTYRKGPSKQFIW
ncbi:MAG: hypothetical protein QHH00_00270 [Methanomassiliicoccales archaeon]|nr:hypothetical protein [Methanomassiliicoccales archaeon]